LILVVAVEG